MNNYLVFTQIAVAGILIVLILSQQRGTALGSAFGGEGGSFYSARRGAQKKIYWLTIVSAILFIALAFLSLVIK